MCRPRSSPIVAIKRGRVARLRAGVDPLVPDIRGREDRAARGARQRRRPTGVGRWMARRIARIRAGQDLALVGEPVAVGVDLVRMGPAVLLVEVAQAVPVAVLLRIRETVAIGVGLARVDHGARLAPVPQAVAVGILEVVRPAVAVAVDLLRVGLREVLVAVGQPVAVRILPGVRQAVPVGVLRGRARPRAVALERVGKAVAIGVRGGVGCARRGGQDHRRQEGRDERASKPRRGPHGVIVGGARSSGYVTGGPSSRTNRRFHRAPAPCGTIRPCVATRLAPSSDGELVDRAGFWPACRLAAGSWPRLTVSSGSGRGCRNPASSPGPTCRIRSSPTASIKRCRLRSR